MQQLKITIPEPCNEQWGNMTTTQKGKFCGSCKKEVIDFSRMEDSEIFLVMKKAMDNNISICGRVEQTQLERPIASTVQKIKTQIAWYWKYVTAVFLFSNHAKVLAQVNPKIKSSKCITPTSNTKVGEMMAQNITIAVPVKKEPIILIPERRQYLMGDTMGFMEPIVVKEYTGKVIDTKGNPMPYASIRIKSAKSGVTADSNGHYKISAKPGAVLWIATMGGVCTITVTENLKLQDAVIEIKETRENQTLTVVSMTMGKISPLKSEKNDLKKIPQNTVPLINVQPYNNLNKTLVTKATPDQLKVKGQMMVTMPNAAVLLKKGVEKAAILPVNNVKTEALSLYPNPAKTGNTIYFDLQDATAALVQIIDLNGIVMQTQVLEKINTNKKIGIRLNEILKTGFYTITVINKKGAIVQSGTLIVE